MIVQVNGQTKFAEKTIWQRDKEQIYRDQLSSNGGQRAFEAVIAKLENNVDDAASDFVECLTSASQCLIKKCHMKKKHLTVDHSKIVQINEQTKFIEKIIWQGDK